MARKGENIRKRNDGRWEGRYRITDAEGARYRSVYAKSYLEVRDKLALEKNTFLQRKELERAGMPPDTFETVAEEWLESIRKSRKESTYLKYCVVYELHLAPFLANVEIQNLTEEMIAEAADDDFSDSTKRSIRCVVNQILRYAFSHYHMKEMHMDKIIATDMKEPVRVLNMSEQSKLLRYINQNKDIYTVGILLCLSTGLRLGEICALKWDDVDLDLKVLHVNSTVQRIRQDNGRRKTALSEGKPKTTFSVREIPLSEQLIPLLKRYHTSGIYFFNGNKPLDPRTYQNKFKTYLRMADLEDNHFHILRHTFATNCINNGTDVKSLSEMLGHSDVNITLNRYVHPSIDVKRNHINSLFTIYGQYMGQQI